MFELQAARLAAGVHLVRLTTALALCCGVGLVATATAGASPRRARHFECTVSGEWTATQLSPDGPGPGTLTVSLESRAHPVGDRYATYATADEGTYELSDAHAAARGHGVGKECVERKVNANELQFSMTVEGKLTYPGQPQGRPRGVPGWFTIFEYFEKGTGRITVRELYFGTDKEPEVDLLYRGETGPFVEDLVMLTGTVTFAEL